MSACIPQTAWLLLLVRGRAVSLPNLILFSPDTSLSLDEIQITSCYGRDGSTNQGWNQSHKPISSCSTSARSTQAASQATACSQHRSPRSAAFSRAAPSPPRGTSSPAQPSSTPVWLQHSLFKDVQQWLQGRRWWSSLQSLQNLEQVLCAKPLPGQEAQGKGWGPAWRAPTVSCNPSPSAAPSATCCTGCLQAPTARDKLLPPSPHWILPCSPAWTLSLT